MLDRLLADLLRGASRSWAGIRSRIARRRLARAVASCAAGRFDEARALCEAASSLAPELPDAPYLLGIIACHGEALEAGAHAIERALELAPGDPRFLAALADALLLQQRPDEALGYYERAFPREASALAGLAEGGLPWARAHPDWTRRLLHVTLPLSHGGLAGATGRGDLPADEIESGHLLNWALVLVAKRRVRQAIHLMQHVLARNPRLGYAHAALSLLYTLNHDWRPALAAALEARRLGAEVFPGATDLCVLAGQLGTGVAGSELDPVFDWSAFAEPAVSAPPPPGPLPPVEGLPFPGFAPDRFIYFIACDPRYFFEYGIPLACSIRESAPTAAVHFHFFNPTAQVRRAMEALRADITPLPLSATWESVDFVRFGGILPYCVAARFARLYELLSSLPPGTRVAMLDADSLVRGDLARALEGGPDIGLVHAPNEPFWHQYLGGFTTFRASPAAARFLGAVSRFLAANLAAGRARLYLDQIALYVGAARHEAEAAGGIDRLQPGKYCDTLFQESALVWSVTQRKGDDSAFDRARKAILKRSGGRDADPDVASPQRGSS